MAMANDDEDPRAKLRALRDKLAFEAPRAQARAKTPPDLAKRLKAALDQVNAAHRLATSSDSHVSEEVAAEVIDDAIVEAHMALHDWERLIERQEEQAQRARQQVALTDRRQSTRQDTDVTVRLLRHAMNESGSGVALETETANRAARNVSMGGIFVSLAVGDLPQVVVGSVLHVAIDTSLGASLGFRARAIVMRRDATGVGLRWIVDTERVTQAIESLLAAVSRSRLGA